MIFSLFKNEHVTAISALFSAIAAACSAVAAFGYGYTAREAEKRQIMQSYITMYAGTLSKADYRAIDTVDGFKNADRNAKNTIEVLDGMLVTLADSMHETEDERATTWSKFIEAIPGPLIEPNFCLERYAKHNQTKIEIEAYRKNIMKSNGINENPCRDHYH